MNPTQRETNAAGIKACRSKLKSVPTIAQHLSNYALRYLEDCHKYGQRETDRMRARYGR